MIAPLDLMIVVMSAINMMIPGLMIFGIMKLMKSEQASRYLPPADSYRLPDDGTEEHKHALLPYAQPVRAKQLPRK